MWNELSNLPIVLRSKLKQIQSKRISNEPIMEVKRMNQESINQSRRVKRLCCLSIQHFENGSFDNFSSL